MISVIVYLFITMTSMYIKGVWFYGFSNAFDASDDLRIIKKKHKVLRWMFITGLGLTGSLTLLTVDILTILVYLRKHIVIKKMFIDC